MTWASGLWTLLTYLEPLWLSLNFLETSSEWKCSFYVQKCNKAFKDIYIYICLLKQTIYAHLRKTKLYYWRLTIKINPAPITHTNWQEKKKKIKIIKIVFISFLIQELCVRNASKDDSGTSGFRGTQVEYRCSRPNRCMTYSVRMVIIQKDMKEQHRHLF
jgi:hypothetical protein